MRTDLRRWVEGLGLSEAEVTALYDAAIRENGLAAKLIGGMAVNALRLPIVDPQLKESGEVLTPVDSGEYAKYLLDQPEPTDEELNQILNVCRDALPNLRQQLLASGRLGPRHRRGGRHKELADPELRQKIREEIKALRKPGVNLEDLYTRMKDKYGGSETTIKRIRLEEDSGKK